MGGGSWGWKGRIKSDMRDLLGSANEHIIHSLGRIEMVSFIF